MTNSDVEKIGPRSIYGGTVLKTVSGRDIMIERDGELYSEAVDPEGMGRVYTETDIPINEPESEADDR